MEAEFSTLTFRILPEKGDQYLKPLAAAITGYRTENFQEPSSWLEVVHREDRKKLKSILEKIPKLEVPIGPCRIRWNHLRGYDVCTELWLFPVYQQSGPLIAIEAIARDTTSQNKLEKDLNFRNAELEVLNQIAFSDDAALTINDLISFSLETVINVAGASEGGIYLLDDGIFSLASSSDGFNNALGEEIVKQFGSKIKVNHFLDSQESSLYKDEWILVPVIELGNVKGLCVLFNYTGKTFLNEPNRRLLKAALNGVGIALTRKKVEEALRLSEEKYKDIIENIEEGYFELNLSGDLVFYNETLCVILGYSRKELSGLQWKKFCLDYDELEKARKSCFSTGDSVKGLGCKALCKNGEEVFLEISLSPIKDMVGIVNGFRGVARDITERKKAEDRLKYLSNHDYLTGLYNRAYFEKELELLASSDPFPFSILTCDVDGLKIINDTMGHEKGDALLRSAAMALKKPFKNGEVVARIGGDEFGIVLPGVSCDGAEIFLKEIQSTVDSYNRSSPEIPLSISIGAASSCSTGQPVLEVLRQSDHNMYRDKLNRSAGARSNIVRSLMVTLAERDFIAQGHAIRMQELVAVLGKAAGVNTHELSDLNLLAQVHDIGKVGVSDHILFKPGKLNEDEWEEMKRHCEIGYRIAMSSPELASIGEQILHHHEWWNGEGYPQGLKGNEIHICSRILAIADAYDAMVSKRPYQYPRSQEEALRELEKYKGIQFDPELTDLFISAFQ